MRQQKILKTDLGTVIFHWATVLALSVSLVTGLRIAADDPTHAWILTVAWLLPQGSVWQIHLIAGLSVASVAVAYTVYIVRARLTKRITLDRARLSGLTHRGKPSMAAFHVVLYWIIYGVLTLQVLTGTLLYLGYSGSALTAHFTGAMLLLAFPVLHVAMHYLRGGMNQILRIFKPVLIEEPRITDSFTDILIAHYVKTNNIQTKPIPSRQADTQGISLHAHPLAIAVAAGLTAAIAVFSADYSQVDRLIVTRILNTQGPRVDGDLSDTAWAFAKPVEIDTDQGANFGGTGASHIVVRAVHTDKFAFFAFTWEDPSRSIKHLPLIKKEDGWHVMNEQYDIEDEDSYYEDKIGVMFSRSAGMGGDGTAHLGAKPLAGMPAAYSGRGLHYTTDESNVDVWHWKAARGGLLGWVDDNYFGPPIKPTPEEVSGKARYKGGYASDPGKAVYSYNFPHESAGGYKGTITPSRLPRSLPATTAAMGRLDLDPNHGEEEGARWWMTEDESQPYTAEYDASIQAGAVIPGVIIAGNYGGDRADVQGAAHWAAGRWTLELFRKMDTESKFDVPFESGISMWVSAFDHSQTRHTRHMKPITLEIEQ